MPPRRPPPSQPTEPLYATPPYMPIIPPPQRIDFDALKASIRESLIRDQTTSRKMLPTTLPPTQTIQPPTTTPEHTETTDNKTPIPPPLQHIDFDALKASILAGLIRDTIRMMPTTLPMTTTHTNKNANTLRRDPLASASTAKELQRQTNSTADAADDDDDFLLMLLTPPTTMPMTANTNQPEKLMTGDPLATDFNPHKQHTLTQSTANVADDDDDEFLMMLLTPPPTMPLTVNTNRPEKLTTCDTLATDFNPHKQHTLTQSTATVADDDDDFLMMLLTPPTTMPMTANTNRPEKKTTCDPLTIDFSSHKQHTLMQSTANVADDDDDFLMMRLTPPTTMPLTANTNRPEKTTTCDPLTIDFTSHKQKPVTPLTDDIVDDDDFLMQLQTTTTMIPMTVHTKRTEETSTDDHPAIDFTPNKQHTLMKYKADAMDDDADDFPMMLQTTMTTMPMTANTKRTEKTKTGDPPAIDLTSHKHHPSTQYTADVADDTEDDSLLMLPMMKKQMMMRATANNDTIAKTMLCTLDKSNATASTLSNSIQMTQFTAKVTNNAEDDFVMIATIPPTPTSLTTFLKNHFFNLATRNPITSQSASTTQWLSATFDPVFNALARLTTEIANLSDSFLAATCTSNQTDPPMPPTPSPQSHYPQPQPLYTSLSKLHHMETIPPNVSNLVNKSQTHSRYQNTHPHQTHQYHRNHTKHRHFLSPPLPIHNHHVSKHLPFPVHKSFHTYQRYLANNFQPP